MILVVALLGGIIVQRLGLPLVLGYILAGIVVGPYTGGPTVGKIEEIELLADIGVALLLFAIGLDFSISKLAPVRQIALIGTPVQIMFTVFLGVGIGRLVGWDWRQALWLGALLSLSSTMVALKTLAEQGILNTMAGRIMTGMLIVQDLAVIPMMVLLPELDNPEQGLHKLGVAVLRAGIFTAGMLLFGTRVLPRLLTRIASWNSRELFLVSVVAVGLGVGYATHLFGLTFSFGAFLAGMILGQSDYSHQALDDIVPLRDVFGTLFFVSVGMLLDPVFLIRNAAVIVIIVVLALLGKGIIFGGVTGLFGYGNMARITVALGMAQVGEFSFVLARLGKNVGAITQDNYTIAIAVAIITMILTPLVSRLAPVLNEAWSRRFPSTVPDRTDVSRAEWRDHIIIGGYGRVGRFIAQVLRGLEQPFAAIDIDPSRVSEAQAAGIDVIYGDAAAEAVLNAAGVTKARLAILTIPDPAGMQLAVERIRRLNPDVRIVARAANSEQTETLSRLGVHEIVQPELEAGLELVHQALAHLGLSYEKIHHFIDQVRREHYAPIIKEVGEHPVLAQLRRTERLIEAEWISLPNSSPLIGKAIGDLDIRAETGASVVAVIREHGIYINPGPDLIFMPGDTVGIIGTPEQRKAFREMSGGGSNSSIVKSDR